MKAFWKRFGGVHALRGASVAFESGDVLAIAGENDASKSTLVKILAGVTAANEYEGAVEIEGVDWRLHSVLDAKRCGVFLAPQ